LSSLLLDTTDLAEAESVLSANFAAMRLSAPEGAPTPFRLERIFVGSMGVDSADYGVGFGFTMEPPEQLLLCSVVAGGIEHHGTDRPVTQIAAGHAGVIGAFDAAGVSGALAGRVLRGHYDHLVLDPRLLSQNAAPSPRSGEVVRLTGSSPTSSAADGLLTATVAYVKRCVTEGDVQENPLLAASLEHQVAAVLLRTLPSTAVFEPTIEDRHDATPALMRKATSFIDDNAQRDLTLSDIANAVHVTPRALQYMFRRHRDCTPMEYLRRVRLHHAHLDLSAGNRVNTTVAQVARRWGFGHLGRFAVYYRSQYGVSPHETLRE
jgi:AraC-like DNA-binding protein